jgi:diacylglycerol kinase family enzyme
VHVLEPDDDLEALARAAETDKLGMAGGDGSLGTVAAAAVERDLAFVPIPFGTRNHFARDLGLTVDDPVAALDAFDGRERRVDVGRAGDRLFLNNVSLGLYAELVHRPERHRRRDPLARLHALLLLARDLGRSDRLLVDGAPVDAHVVLVANNAYELEAFEVGARGRLDAGKLRLYIAHGWRPATWEERACDHLTIDAASHRVKAAVDGEPSLFELPLEFRIEPLALRVLVPPG